MSRFWSEIVHKLTPYVPGEQTEHPDLVKLNTNENPYGPSPRALEALRGVVNDSLRLYPDPASTRLCEAIAERHGVRREQVFVGNGSDEVLAHTFRALLTHGAPVLFPDVTYSFYPVYCNLFGTAYREISLGDEFQINVDDFLQDNGGIIFPNPNAPTGRALALSDIERLVAANTDSVIVIDEAYVDFGCQSAVPLVDRYPQLLVTHTLSKSYALAGLRVGYAIGNPDLISALNRVKNSFNSYPLDRMAQVAAVAAIEDHEYLSEVCSKVIDSRSALIPALQDLGLEVLPSAANFVLARHPVRDGAELSASLRKRCVIVRHFRSPDRVAPYLRITVGTDDQCSLLLAALRGILE